MFSKKHSFMRILLLLIFVLPLDSDIFREVSKLSSSSTTVLLPQQDDYPGNCNSFSHTENTTVDCMLYHMDFLVNTDTANALRDVSILRRVLPSPYDGLLLSFNLTRFAFFVAPDQAMLWHHPAGSPADVKSFYQDEYTLHSNSPSTSIYPGGCIPIFGEDYGYDFPGNLIFGYIGAHAGFNLETLLIGAGNVQILNDTFIKGASPLASAGSPQNLLTTYGDQPSDQVATRIGYELYQSCGKDCSAEDVRQILAKHRSDYVHAEHASPTSVCRPESGLRW